MARGGGRRRRRIDTCHKSVGAASRGRLYRIVQVRKVWGIRPSRDTRTLDAIDGDGQSDIGSRVAQVREIIQRDISAVGAGATCTCAWGAKLGEEGVKAAAASRLERGSSRRQGWREVRRSNRTGDVSVFSRIDCHTVSDLIPRPSQIGQIDFLGAR